MLKSDSKSIMSNNIICPLEHKHVYKVTFVLALKQVVGLLWRHIFNLPICKWVHVVAIELANAVFQLFSQLFLLVIERKRKTKQ